MQTWFPNDALQQNWSSFGKFRVDDASGCRNFSISWTSLISITIRDGCSRAIVVPVWACRINVNKNLQRKDIQMSISMWKDTRIYGSRRSHIESKTSWDFLSLWYRWRDTTCEHLIDRKENETECLSTSISWQIETQKILSSSVETKMTERTWRLGTWNILPKWTRKDTFRVRSRELQEYWSWGG